jgi:DNA polymerase (family 10)
MHTTENRRARVSRRDGRCRARPGYEYVAITDHSKALAMANGPTKLAPSRFAQRVRDINASGSLGIRVFSGLECDILKDGRLDLAGDALAELDLVIGSVRRHMNMESAEMTARLLSALERPQLKVLGHPTGRILLHRDPFPSISRKWWIAPSSAASGSEINASPERLDLGAAQIRAAARGAKFVICTDAHHPSHLQHALRRAPGAAGLAGPDAILNTLSADRRRRRVQTHEQTDLAATGCCAL